MVFKKGKDFELFESKIDSYFGDIFKGLAGEFYNNIQYILVIEIHDYYASIHI